MTMAEKDASLSDGRPIELYEFRYGPGDNDVYLFTDAEKDFAIGDNVYVAAPISRGGITSSGTLDKTKLTVEVHITNPVVELFRVYAPSHTVVLTIWGGHENDPDEEFLVIWAGRVLSCNRQAGEKFKAALTCEPASTSMRRPGLRRRYQLSCPHVLFGDKCGLDRADFLIEADVVSISGTTVTLAPGWSGVTTYTKFVGGMLNYTDDAGMIQYRTILRTPSAVTLSLTGVLTGLLAGDTLQISRGCDHQLDTCRDEFNNVLNYGGFPWIPLKNPVKTNPFN